MMFEDRCVMFILLLQIHAVTDFALQSDLMDRYKRRRLNVVHAPWYYWLTAHSFICGAGVTLITGSVYFGLIETVLHWLIDYLRTEEVIRMSKDQFLHILCRLFYVIVW